MCAPTGEQLEPESLAPRMEGSAVGSAQDAGALPRTPGFIAFQCYP